MTRKHYNQLASLCATLSPTERDRFTAELCIILKQDNSAFDPERFRNAVQSVADGSAKRS